MNRDDEIFADALDLPPAARDAFLDRVCAGEPAMRARVAALLAGHEEAAGFLDVSAIARANSLPEEKPGDVIGRYTLVRKLGEGGCGVVYLALQTEPVRRHVALKVIKLGMDTREVIARFEGERQALAMMDHPDIARVFDAGSTATGRPFFVMEFVDGVPITKFCDAHSLSMDARLWLFARVCVALQHAHQKGIIHRDLKPSNILVSLLDGAPAPKVIDFGIAKATSGRLTAATLVTGFDQFLGTPAYMSPEQAELRDLDIDTRSDVYSLGVLLYELLTGRPPYDPQSLVRAGLAEIRRIIREVDPPRPSTRVSTLNGADRDTVARLRGAAPAKLRSALSGDLDWIVMRCLEKDRDRRYSTANELAEDVRRHLRSEPVVARPPDALYRLQRFVARNRLACASAAAVAAALVIGTVVSVRQAVLATRASQAEALARSDAQRRQEQAEALLTFMLGDFRTELKKAGKLSLLDEVGEKALAYFASLDPRDLTDTALARQAKALTQIGETRMDEARYTEASAAFATAYSRASALAARHPRDGDMLFERAQAEYWLGFSARKRGDAAAGREWYGRYRDSAVALVQLEGKKYRAQRELTSGHHNLAVLDMDRGDLPAAQAGFLAERSAVEEMLTANPGDTALRYRLADVASWLGSVAENDGTYSLALERFEEMRTRTEALIALEPTVARWKWKLSESLMLSGAVQALSGRRDEAITAYAKATALAVDLVAQDPRNQQWLIARLRSQLQEVLLRLPGGASGTMAPVLAEARAKLESLVAAEPTSQTFSRLLATALRIESLVRFAAGRPDADEPVARAVTLTEALVKLDRANDWVAWEFAQSQLLAGRIAAQRGDRNVAQRHWERVVEFVGPRAANSHDWRLLDPAAQALTLLGRAEEARPLVERLQRFGYHALDPLAASLLDAALSPPTNR